MSTTYALRFDTGNDAFQEGARDSQSAWVIREAAARIAREGVDSGFKLFDLNGNSIGTFSETTPPATPDRGEVLVLVDTGDDAFKPDPTHELVRILRESADRIARGDWPAGLVDINGNKVGSIADNVIEPEIELPDDVVKLTLKDIFSKADGVEFYVEAERREALARELDLGTFAESWRMVGVVMDEDGDPSDVWVSLEANPSEGKAFMQVMRNGMVEDWAEDFEAELNGAPAPRRYR